MNPIYTPERLNYYSLEQVAAKDTEIGTWSDWSVAVYATTWIGEITSPPEVDPVIPGKKTLVTLDPCICRMCSALCLNKV